MGTIRSASASDGGILVWDNLVRGQPLADYGRSTKMQDGCQSLERRQSLWKNREMFFQSLHNDPFAKHWYYDSEGDTLCTLLKNRNPIMESFRKCGLHGSRVEVSPSESCTIGEAVLSLVAEERIRQLFTAWGHSGREGIDSMSGGSMSPDLGEMWRQGYLVSRGGRVDWNWTLMMTMKTRMKITTVTKRATALMKVVQKITSAK